MKTRKLILSVLLFLAILCSSLAVFYFWIIPTVSSFLTFFDSSRSFSWNRMWVILAAVIGYLLISFCLCSFISIFKKMKPIDDNAGLFFKLIMGFLFGFACGIILGFFFGIIAGIASGLNSEFICFFVALVLLGIELGFILSAFWGIRSEIKDYKANKRNYEEISEFVLKHGHGYLPKNT
jgi:flagellar biosynthesis protein FliQ